MRSKIKVGKKYYRPVPWIKDCNCEGCEFDQEGCINVSSYGNPCDDGNEFSGMILIPHTKEAMAVYMARRLGADDEDPVD